jgi:hypothetical protein
MVRTTFDMERRGQVLLVGALALAFILIGLAVVFNAVTYTGQTSVPEAGSSVNDASQFDFEARRGARELVLRVNHASPYNSESELTQNVAANVSNYSAVMGATYSGHGAAVNVSFESATSDYGKRIVQSEEMNFTDTGLPSGSSTWVPVSGAERLGWVVVNVNASTLAKTPGNAYTINVSNSSGEYIRYHIYQSSGAAVNVSVDSSFVSTGGPYQYNATRGHVVVNLLEGTSPMNRSSQMRSPIRRLNDPDTVEFSNGDAGKGQYSIVVPDSSASYGVPDCSSVSVGPCYTPALWNVTVKTHYESPTVNVTHNQTITVYNSTS